MNLLETILEEHSKKNCDKIISWVGTDQKRFDELFLLFLNDEYRVTQRASWPLSFCTIAHPFLIEKKLDKLLRNLKKPGLHNAVKRNTVRLLQHVNIPEQNEGVVMEICFEYLESPNEAVAVKAFALNTLSKLAKKYPEISPEVKLLIEDQIAHQSAAFKVSARRFLKEFS
ncbi:MAG: hypothetical protein ABI683_15450 [Ginsengibacter sp.]